MTHCKDSWYEFYSMYTYNTVINAFYRKNQSNSSSNMLYNYALKRRCYNNIDECIIKIIDDVCSHDSALLLHVGVTDAL